LKPKCEKKNQYAIVVKQIDIALHDQVILIGYQ
jgi:hypothetical protein